MSHVGDFDGLENFSPEAQEAIKQVRIEARSIIGVLEPFHLLTWGDLISRLKYALQKAEQEARLAKQEAERGRKQSQSTFSIPASLRDSVI